MNLILIGPSGSGKGTQGKLLAKKLGGMVHVSMGRWLRQEVEKGSELGSELSGWVNKGKWAPTELVMRVLEKGLTEVSGGVVLDGVPRYEEQIEPLMAILKKTGRKIDKVVYLKISDDEAVRRLSARLVCPVDGEEYNLLTRRPEEDEVCDKHKVKLVRREDDQPEKIRSRLREFHRTMAPVLAYFREKGWLIEVNGERPIEAINDELVEQLGGK